ncbi:MAG: hypothetical protein KKB51_06755 [Candidatus Riflebacteria bacterium]|nr:hypothetical protein [Candidatus Riflebacteria bacterium]
MNRKLFRSRQKTVVRFWIIVTTIFPHGGGFVCVILRLQKKLPGQAWQLMYYNLDSWSAFQSPGMTVEFLYGRGQCGRQ